MDLISLKANDFIIKKELSETGDYFLRRPGGTPPGGEPNDDSSERADKMRFELMVPRYVIFQVWCIKPLCHMSSVLFPLFSNPAKAG